MTGQLITLRLTDEQKSHICGVLSIGCDWHTAANFVDCSLADIRCAMRDDPEFAARVRRTEAGAEVACMRTIHEAAKDPKNWRTAVWWLERHAPERFARNAGIVTARQLKTFIALLADVLHGGEQTPLERREIIARLKTFAESVDRLLRHEQLCDDEALDFGETDLPADELPEIAAQLEASDDPNSANGD